SLPDALPIFVARSGDVRDTDLGRVVEVTVEVAVADDDGDETPLCTLTERFAIRGRTGRAELGEPRPAGGALVDGAGETITPAENKRQKRVSTTLNTPQDMTAHGLLSGDHNPV